MSSAKQAVLVFGATGRTGSSILQALITSGNFELYAAVRPASQHKPEVESLRNSGVSILLSDLATVGASKDDFNALVTILKGKDTVISMTDPMHLDWQIPLADACKQADVKRYIPCDVGTACIRGVRSFFDMKLNIHDHIEKIGLGHTYVDVGWWFQITLPITELSKAQKPENVDHTRSYYIPEDGKEIKSALTDLRDIGLFFARIIADERTLNRYVFCWSQEKSQKEIWALVKNTIGKDVPKIEIPGSVLANRIEVAKQNNDWVATAICEYAYSIWIRGDNIVENAKKSEYGSALDARELYPDLKLKTLEEFVEEVYGPGSENVKLGY